MILSCRAQQELYPIDIQIANDSIKTLSDKSVISISILCKNNNNKNLLLYGFYCNVLTTYVDRICANNDRASGGIGLRVFNDKHERIQAVHFISDSIDHKPMPRERFEQLMIQGRAKYLKATKILKASSTERVDRNFDLREFHLVKGTYYLQIIVYAGKSLITHMVGEEQIKEDKEANNAELYQGCAISNEIMFRVE